MASPAASFGSLSARFRLPLAPEGVEPNAAAAPFTNVNREAPRLAFGLIKTGRALHLGVKIRPATDGCQDPGRLRPDGGRP